MNNITKVSQITVSDLVEYIRLPDATSGDENTLNDMLGVAKQFITNYTGIASTALDNYEDFVIVVFVLVQDMWDNRSLYVDTSNLNYVIEAILGMHSVNLL